MDSRAKKCLLCLTLLAALCGSLPAALAQPAAPAARTGRIERVTIADERGDHGLPSPFTHAPDGVGYALTMLVFDSLLWRDRQGHLVPALARPSGAKAKTAWPWSSSCIRRRAGTTASP